MPLSSIGRLTSLPIWSRLVLFCQSNISTNMVSKRNERSDIVIIPDRSDDPPRLLGLCWWLFRWDSIIRWLWRLHAQSIINYLVVYLCLLCLLLIACIKKFNRSNDFIILLFLDALKRFFIENNISANNDLVNSRIPQPIPLYSFSIDKKDAPPWVLVQLCPLLFLDP